MVLEADVNENYYSEIGSISEDSDNEVSDEDHVLDQIFGDSQKEGVNAIPSILVIHDLRKTLRLTIKFFACENTLTNHENDPPLKTVRSWLE